MHVCIVEPGNDQAPLGIHDTSSDVSPRAFSAEDVPVATMRSPATAIASAHGRSGDAREYPGVDDEQ